MSKFHGNRLHSIKMDKTGDGAGAGGSGTGGDGGKPPETPPAKKPEGQAPDGQQGKGKEGDGPGDLDYSDPKATKKVIDDLRTENAKHRNKNKQLETSHSELSGRFSKLEGGLKKLFGDGDEKLTPEQLTAKLNESNTKTDSLEVQNAILSAGIEFGVGKDQMEFFEFQVNKKINSLKENEEMSDDDWSEIVKKCGGNAQHKPNSSVDANKANGGGSGNPPSGNTGGDEVTVEQFSAMSIGEKSALYNKDQKLYQALFNQAKSKGTLLSDNSGPRGLASRRGLTG